MKAAGGDSAVDSALVVDVLSPEFSRTVSGGEISGRVAASRPEAWTVCVGFEGSSEVCERYGRDLTRLARVRRSPECDHRSRFAVLGNAGNFAGGPGANEHGPQQSVVFRFATLPRRLPDLLRALRSFASSSWTPSAVLVRSGSIVYLALLPRDGDESTLKQIAYFWKSVGSLRGKIEFSASILVLPDRMEIRAGRLGDTLQRTRIFSAASKKAFDPGGVLSLADASWEAC